MPAEGGRGGGGAGGGAYRIHELISERPAEWGFSSLAPLQASGASGAGPGLSMGIPDTILCEEGSAHRWLFTSKDGVILRKRRLNPNSVTERISRLAETNPHNPFLRSGILRFSDGRVQALNQAVVNEILTKFPTMGQGVVAFQSFIQGAGNSGTIHRCTYSVIDDKANTVCETATFTTLEQAEPGQDRLEWRNDRPPGCVPSRARAVNRALQGATKEIVRHIETSQREPSRILKVQLDYAIDPTGAIWLLWVGPSTVAVGAAAQDLRLVLGDAAAAESQLKAMARTQRRMEKTGDAGAASMLVDSPRLLGGIVGGATAAVELSSPSRVAIRATGSDLGASLGSSVSPKPSMTALKSTMTVGLLPAARGVGAGWGGGCNDKVACSGDFCRVVVQDPREDADDPRRGCAAASLDQSSCSSNSSCGAPTETGLVKAVAMRLFSAQELSILRRDETFRRQLQEGQLDELRLENLGPEVGSSRQRAKANPGSSPLEARARVLWKSIAMARSERSSEPHSSTDRGDDSAGHTRTTESSNFREASVRRADPRRLMALGAVDGCPRDPYEAVGVCSACFIVYTLLDRARAILKKQQEEADEQAAATSRAMRVQTPPTVSSPLRVTNAGQSTKGRPGSPGTLVPVHAASASGGQARKRLNATTNPLSSQYGTQSLLLSRSQRATKSSKRGFGSLDDYLRGKARSKGRNGTTDKAKAKEKAKLAGTTDAASSSLQVGRVLVGESDEAAAAEVRRLLEQAGFMVTTEGDGRRILELLLGPDSDLAGATGYDVVMLSTSSLHLVDAFEVTSAVRDSEKRRRSQLARERAELVKTEGRSALMEAGEVAQLPIIAFAHETGPNDLRRYMLAGMDGCVSKPVKSRALLNTIHAAVPHHLAKERPTPPPSPARGQNVTSFGALKGSSAVAETALPSATRPAGRDEDVHGALQVDADTSIVYCILGGEPQATAPPVFNLVLCHDLFDHYERMKISMAPIVSRYPGTRCLLWNYPGQACTEWRRGQVLNNEYLASLLEQLLHHTNFSSGRAQPFHLVGFGSGGSVASFFASHYACPSMRSVVLFNAFSYVDPYLAGVLHDCVNVFSCSPESRPDLPIYFYARFLFSPAYLARVTAPLALNIYTAVHNPITVAGRVALCEGALSHVDLRPVLGEIDVPIICVQSSNGNFVRPSHVGPFVTGRKGGEARSIHRALTETGPASTCVVWLSAGHEVFQEAKDQTRTLLEQMVAGYHETNDMVWMEGRSISETSVGVGTKSLGITSQGATMTGNQGPFARPEESPVIAEDGFIDSVLGTMESVQRSAAQRSRAMAPESAEELDHLQHTAEDLWNSTTANVEVHGETWDAFRTAAMAPCQGSMSSSSGANRQGKARRGKKKGTKSSDPTGTVSGNCLGAFDTAGGSSGQQSSQTLFPEVQEYMQWRLRRNQKRLLRLQRAAIKIQCVLRAHLAKRRAHALRLEAAALYIQRIWRGWRGRLDFLEELRCLWAAQLLQRNWRGYAGRQWFALLRMQTAAVGHMQRVWRGALARRRVRRLRGRQDRGATALQALVRGYWGRKRAFAVRRATYSATAIQRVYRGHLGRREAGRERDKYVFSKSQSAGIEFGRQMLLEHKLHATRLQSEVVLLTKEKVAAEESVEAMLEEIGEFEEGVTILEREMHQLGRIEAEASSALDEASRYELREQKVRLDAEFGAMLGKIADRKERLSRAEAKLASLDRARMSKEEELRGLERKLVVLLEEQQKELDSIRQRQEKKSALVLAAQSGSSEALVALGGGASGGWQGPSAKDKRQAAQLMQSTETLMKFGFMSMSMTYFSSLNLIRAMRKVGATDTVMAALTQVPQDGVSGSPGESGSSLPAQPFKPTLKPGELPGSQSLRVSAWSVEDVGRWLQTLSLPQYQEALREGAVDGAFLYDITDDDLKNTLGVDHRLHRKKLLKSIERLKRAEMERDRNISLSYGTSTGGASPGGPNQALRSDASSYLGDAEEAMGQSAVDPATLNDSPPLQFAELATYVRHGKYKLLKQVLEQLPDRTFDKELVRAQYVQDVGTAYVAGYEAQPFHMNMTDKHGNTLLMLAAQNGSVKSGKLFYAKGANPNHQNKVGHTAGHYALAYSFFDFSEWIFSASGAAADDSIENMYGLGPYDGLAPGGGDSPSVLAIGSGTSEFSG